jgi:hypothetical protein
VHFLGILDFGVGFDLASERRMTRTAKRALRLLDSYCFSGFRPAQTVCGVFGDPKARVIRLSRTARLEWRFNTLDEDINSASR